MPFLIFASQEKTRHYISCPPNLQKHYKLLSWPRSENYFSLIFCLQNLDMPGWLAGCLEKRQHNSIEKVTERSKIRSNSWKVFHRTVCCKTFGSLFVKFTAFLYRHVKLVACHHQHHNLCDVGWAEQEELAPNHSGSFRAENRHPALNSIASSPDTHMHRHTGPETHTYKGLGLCMCCIYYT